MGILLPWPGFTFIKANEDCKGYSQRRGSNFMTFYNQALTEVSVSEFDELE